MIDEGQTAIHTQVTETRPSDALYYRSLIQLCIYHYRRDHRVKYVKISITQNLPQVNHSLGTSCVVVQTEIQINQWVTAFVQLSVYIKQKHTYTLLLKPV